MSNPMFIRPLTDAERDALQGGLRSPYAFTLRRSQYLLASAQGRTPAAIAGTYGGTAQSVRNCIRDFAQRGVVCITRTSNAPKKPHAVWPRERDGELKALLHQSPRTCGKSTSLWSLDLLAEVCYEKGWTTRLLTGEALRHHLKRLAINWQRAKHWLTSPDPDYIEKKGNGTSGSKRQHAIPTGC